MTYIYIYQNGIPSIQQSTCLETRWMQRDVAKQHTLHLTYSDLVLWENWHYMLYLSHQVQFPFKKGLESLLHKVASICWLKAIKPSGKFEASTFTSSGPPICSWFHHFTLFNSVQNLSCARRRCPSWKFEWAKSALLSVTIRHIGCFEHKCASAKLNVSSHVTS